MNAERTTCGLSRKLARCQTIDCPCMTSRLERFGERALGQVQSVSPRVSSRFEPEPGASTPEEPTGFQEVDVETPAPRQARRVALPQSSAAAVELPPPKPERIEGPEPPRAAQDANPRPVAIERPSTPPQPSKPAAPRMIVAEPASKREENEKPQRDEEHRDEISLPLHTEKPAIPRVPETSLSGLKRLQEWIAAPPREREAAREPAPSPPPKPAPPLVTSRTAMPAPAPRLLQAPARDEPAPAPRPPVVVSIGTIIVRANPAAASRPAPPPPAASLATFLARRTAGQP